MDVMLGLGLFMGIFLTYGFLMALLIGGEPTSTKQEEESPRPAEALNPEQYNTSTPIGMLVLLGVIIIVVALAASGK